MLLLLSPAKSLDFDSPLAEVPPATAPIFPSQAAQLVTLLRRHSQEQIAGLMELSDPLAALNLARYKAWRRTPAPGSTRQAVLAFDGDVYGGLAARNLQAEELSWAQQHLAILSGMYGVLRPLDAMQPHRLEMSTRLANAGGSNLYQFWGKRIAGYLNERLQADAEPVVVNLASQEYFKAVDRKLLRARVVECVFEEERDGRHKIISFMAKRARGLMARYAIDQRADRPEQLQAFCMEGYAFVPDVSTLDRMVFRRAAPA